VSRLAAMTVLLGAGLAAIGAARLFGLAPAISAAAVAPPTTKSDSPPLAPPFGAVGSAGCSSAACHGGSIASLAAPLNSHAWSFAATQCLTCDPHRRAYAALETPLANQIMRRMHPSAKQESPATEDVRCLACHTNPSLAKPSRQLPELEIIVRREGVGCDSCHGNGQKYLHAHTTWTAANRPGGYQATGMTRLYDLGERALVCAGCHVGAPAEPERGYFVPRDMNHDMIASGHPRLNFDFADSQHRLPPHWLERDRATGAPAKPEFEVKAWLVGRAAQAEAAERLHQDRFQRHVNEASAPWPEFAESNCYSCHHQLLPEGWNQKSPTTGLGLAPRQTLWPLTNPNLVAALKGKAPNKLTDAEVLAVVKRLLVDLYQREAIADWDTACQVFHAAAAYERYRIRATDDRSNPAFEAVLARLRLPQTKGTGSYRSPVSFKPVEAMTELKKLLPR
jgi:hypothetical protein